MRVHMSVSAAVIAVISVACGGSQPQSQQTTAAPGAVTSAPANVSTDKNAYPVFPDADAGADPSVPAEQGGKGFTGNGWETNTDFDLIGDPRAVKAGLFHAVQLESAATLRIHVRE